MSEPRPAYLIVSSIQSADGRALKPYAEAVGPLLAKAAATPIVSGPRARVVRALEGNWAQHATFSVFKFPSMDALEAFWNSAEYQAIKHMRTDVVEQNFAIAVEGD